MFSEFGIDLGMGRPKPGLDLFLGRSAEIDKNEVLTC